MVVRHNNDELDFRYFFFKLFPSQRQLECSAFSAAVVLYPPTHWELLRRALVDLLVCAQSTPVRIRASVLFRVINFIDSGRGEEVVLGLVLTFFFATLRGCVLTVCLPTAKLCCTCYKWVVIMIVSMRPRVLSFAFLTILHTLPAKSMGSLHRVTSTHDLRCCNPF